MKIGIINVIVL